MTENHHKDFLPWTTTTPSRRRFRRWSVRLPTTVTIGSEPKKCLVHDLSPGGARIELADGQALATGGEVLLSLDGYGSIPAEVRYSEDGKSGLMFIHEATDETMLAQFLVSLQPPRHPARQGLTTEATLQVGRAEHACVLESLSSTGAGILLDDAGRFPPGTEVVLRIPGGVDIAATVQRAEGRRLGLMFNEEHADDTPIS